MNTKTLSIIILLFTLLPLGRLMAQSTISGQITDTKSRPIEGVNVILKGTYDGVASDSEGYFSFGTQKKGIQKLILKHLNFRTDTVTINIPSQCNNIKIKLKKKKTESLQEVVISVSRFSVSDKGSSSIIKPLDVYTNPSGDADLASGLKAMPGLQDVDNESGFFIRGGASEEASVTIDGVTIRNFFNASIPNTSGRSRFEVGMFKGMSLGLGGYSAQYGDATSGLLELTLAGKPNRSLINFGLSPLFAYIGTGQLTSNKKHFMEVNYTYGNSMALKPLLKKSWHFNRNNDSHQGSLRYIADWSERDKIKALVLFSSNRMDVDQEYQQSKISTNFKNKNTFFFSMFSYTHYFENQSKLNISSGYSKEQNNPKLQFKLPGNMIQPWIPTQYGNKTNEELAQIHAVWNKSIRRKALRLGIDYQVLKQQVEEKRYINRKSAAYGELNMAIINNISSHIGLRAEYGNSTNGLLLLPRFSTSYKINKNNTMTLDAGLYSRPADYFNRQRISWDFEEKSAQYNLTYQLKNKDSQILRVQAFDKEYRNLALFMPSSNSKKTSDIQVAPEGKGYARGIDIFWKDPKTIRNFEYWISYSYTDSKRKYLHYPIMAHPEYVAKHSASLVTKKWIGSLNSMFNVGVSYRSGVSYYNPQLPQEQFMDERTPSTFSLSVSWNKLFNIGKMSGVAVVSVNGICNANPTYGYRFIPKIDEPGNFYKEKISSPIRQFIFLGVFINIGTDRRKEIINSNL